MGCNHVQKILSDMRNAIDNKKFYPINRRKNLDTLAHLGISWDAAKEEIYDLKEEDYKSGPSVDRDDPSSDHFWVFKKKVGGNLKSYTKRMEVFGLSAFIQMNTNNKC